MKIVGFRIPADEIEEMQIHSFNGKPELIIIPEVVGRIAINTEVIGIRPERRFGSPNFIVNLGLISFYIPIRGCGSEKTLTAGILKGLCTGHNGMPSFNQIVHEFSVKADEWFSKGDIPDAI